MVNDLEVVILKLFELSGVTNLTSRDFSRYNDIIKDNLKIQRDISIENEIIRKTIEDLNKKLQQGNKTTEEKIQIEQSLVDLNTKLANNTSKIIKLEQSRVKLQETSVQVGNEVVNNIEDQLNSYQKLEKQLQSIDITITDYQNQIEELSQEESQINKQRIKELEALIELLNKRKVVLADSFEPEQQLSKFTKRLGEINKKSDEFFAKYEGEIQIIAQSIQTINDVTAAAFDFRLQLIENERLAMEERYDRELELLNRNADEDVKRVENSLLSEEVKASEIKRLRDQEANDQKIIENRRERERRALERERNRTQQKSAISQAIMGAALAVIQAFAQLGPIAGAIASAGIITTTGLQIATIKRQKFNKGGKVKGPGSDMSDSIPAMLSNGESVINANSTKMFEPLLSKINEIGGGVRFNRGGVAGDTPTMTQSEIVDIEKLARRIGEEMRSNPVKAYVVGNDVSNQQQIDAQIKRRSIV